MIPESSSLKRGEKVSKPIDPELAKMIADYMEKGFLDNIVDMFKHDSSLYSFLPGLISDDRLRVRIGATALVETLIKEDSGNIKNSVPFLLPLIKSNDPHIRGDAANLIGLLGNEDNIPDLEKLMEDPNQDIRLIAHEAISEIRTRSRTSPGRE